MSAYKHPFSFKDLNLLAVSKSKNTPSWHNQLIFVRTTICETIFRVDKIDSKTYLDVNVTSTSRNKYHNLATCMCSLVNLQIF